MRHLRAPTQFKLIVKNESVAIYGLVGIVVSGLGIRILHVAQHPSTLSTLNISLVAVVPLKV